MIQLQRALPAFALVLAPSAAFGLQGESLLPSTLKAKDALGRAVATSGERILVGAPELPGGTPTGPGYAVVFARNGAAWTEEARLDPPFGSQGDGFGSAVAIDGDLAAVGAPGSDAAASDAGAVFVYERQGGAWSLAATLLPSGAQSWDAFGQAVALAGQRLVVGSPGSGTAAVYENSGGGWQLVQPLEPAAGADFANGFGSALALDGDRLAVGAPGLDSLGYDSGGVYLFEHDGSAWVQRQLVEASDGATVTAIGEDVALAGARLVVGSWNQTVYTFTLVGGAFGNEERLLPADAATAGSAWGTVLALAGERLVVGAPSDDTAASNAGAVHVYRRSAGAWFPQEVVVRAGAAFSDAFGESVALSGALLVTGAPGVDAVANQAGAAFALELFPEAPWHDLGQGLAGALLPFLVPAGTLAGGSPTALIVAGGPSNGTAIAVLGLSAIHLPLLGGVLVPSPDQVIFNLPLDAEGELTATFAWPPSLPVGFQLYAQFFLPDPSGPLGFTATNAVLGTQP